MMARILKWLVIGIIAIIVVAVWAGTRFFYGIDLGGAGHSPSSNVIEDYINIKREKSTWKKWSNYRQVWNLSANRKKNPNSRQKPNNCITMPFIMIYTI
ncbi:hypothetical protein BKK56_04895 [Rodentibacter genomosp. 2]|uniref:hypothetical protein n=1 Tax=Rodentibacter genomosp. 2 TaxID=1908266 RepID=UPI0009C78C24|nr:hypothetical protein BKK56_04895 [Rodentibacter genomosp. 2]